METSLMPHAFVNAPEMLQRDNNEPPRSHGTGLSWWGDNGDSSRPEHIPVALPHVSHRRFWRAECDRRGRRRTSRQRHEYKNALNPLVLTTRSESVRAIKSSSVGLTGRDRWTTHTHAYAYACIHHRICVCTSVGRSDFGVPRGCLARIRTIHTRDNKGRLLRL